VALIRQLRENAAYLRRLVADSRIGTVISSSSGMYLNAIEALAEKHESLAQYFEVPGPISKKRPRKYKLDVDLYHHDEAMTRIQEIIKLDYVYVEEVYDNLDEWNNLTHECHAICGKERGNSFANIVERQRVQRRGSMSIGSAGARKLWTIVVIY
jgi:hypothetical protein